jgi:hypothetical protein
MIFQLAGFLRRRWGCRRIAAAASAGLAALAHRAQADLL